MKHPREQYGQLLDASFNRLGEALRTVEDHARFGPREGATFRRWKDLRHQASSLRTRVEEHWGRLSAWRQVGSDPGAPTDRSSHEPWRSAGEMLAANLSRARESARSIEETLRVGLPELAADAERLRYSIYEAEAETLGALDRGARLADARLYVLVTSSLCAGPILETTRLAIEGGAQMIQLREKEMPNREFLALARDMRDLTRDLGALFIINDRVEIAALCHADGVHQGQDDLPPAAVREIAGSTMIVGVSTHGPSQAEQAEVDGADYIGVGPIFETRTKEHRSAVGLDYIRESQAATSLPGFAIGSVNRDTLDSVIEAGANRVAICTGVIGAEDPRAAAKWCRERLESTSDGEREETRRTARVE